MTAAPTSFRALILKGKDPVQPSRIRRPVGRPVNTRQLPGGVWGAGNGAGDGPLVAQGRDDCADRERLPLTMGLLWLGEGAFIEPALRHEHIDSARNDVWPGAGGGGR